MFDLAATLKPVTDRALILAKMLLGLDQPTLYRPEAHYMRGPGPKWCAKHGVASQRLPRRGLMHFGR